VASIGQDRFPETSWDVRRRRAGYADHRLVDFAIGTFGALKRL
jgi:hypothetical protein